VKYLGDDDGGTEGPERGAEARSAGAPRGVGSVEGRRSPSPVWGSGAMPPEKIFKKSTLKSRIFGPHKLDTPPKNSLPGCTGEGVDTLIPQTQILVSYMKFRKIITAISKNGNFRRRYMLI